MGTIEQCDMVKLKIHPKRTKYGCQGHGSELVLAAAQKIPCGVNPSSGVSEQSAPPLMETPLNGHCSFAHNNDLTFLI
jgi:hypothetical protein